MSEHATVKLDGADIPLIGVPATATAEKCDLCQAVVHLSQAHCWGLGFVCDGCRIAYLLATENGK